MKRLSRRGFLGVSAGGFAAMALEPVKILGADMPELVPDPRDIDPTLPVQRQIIALLSGPTAEERMRERQPHDAEAMVRVTVLKTKLAGLDMRLTRLDGKVAFVVERFDILELKQDELDRKVAVFCEGNKELRYELEATLICIDGIARKLEEVNCRLANLESQLDALLCQLKKLNCMLCGLADAIRRAKLRAFVLGVLVGIGIGAAIGGGGGGAGVGSVSIW